MNADNYSSRNYTLEPQPLISPGAYSCPNCSTPTENSFKDSDGDTFEVASGDDYVELLYTDSDDDSVTTIAFYKRDAAKIVQLITEAAK